jgi:hypothetical protein
VLQRRRCSEGRMTAKWRQCEWLWMASVGAVEGDDRRGQR